MQKWEYIYVVNTPKEYYVNGVKRRYETNETIFIVINKLGKEGWELVAQPQLTARTFKRPLA
jgi:hypothetical protein